MPPKLTRQPSKSIIAAYNNLDAEGGTKFNISGRATSVLGSAQGDHVTAYRLIEEGLYRVISNFEHNEVTELSLLENRNLIRKRRDHLFGYVALITALDPPRSNALYEGVILELEKYNEARYKKTAIREASKLAKKEDYADEIISIVVTAMSDRYRFNGEKARELFSEVSRHLLTFYNKIPGSAYFPIKGFEAKSGEGPMVLKAITNIDKLISEFTPEDSGVEIKDKIAKIIPNMVELIHYPQITGDDAQVESILGEHRALTLDRGAKKTAKARDNSEEGLVLSLARHLHILSEVFPELSDRANFQEDVLKPFVVAFVADDRTGWERYSNEEGITTIVGKTIEQLGIFKAEGEKMLEKFTNPTIYASSEDEEELVAMPQGGGAAKKPSKEELMEKLAHTEKRLAEAQQKIELLQFQVQTAKAAGYIPAVEGNVDGAGGDESTTQPQHTIKIKKGGAALPVVGGDGVVMGQGHAP